MIRPLGALPDPAHLARGKPIRELVGAALDESDDNFLSAIDFRRHARIRDQRGNSCVGYALAQCLHVRASLLDYELDPSALAIYAIARELEAPSRRWPADPLPDVGSYPFRAIEGLEEWGVVARTRWPDEGDVGAPVPQDVLEAGALARVDGVYRFVDAGSDRMRAIRRAIGQGHPVFFAMRVDDSYMVHVGDGVWGGLTGPVRGGHAQCIVGYRPGAYLVANSWGTGWGFGGFAWVASEWLNTDYCFDFTAITATPSEVR